MDATLNEAKGLDIVIYPTIIFYPKWNKDGVKYEEQPRDLESFKKWVEENSSII